MRVKDISIKWQLLTICVLLVAISVAVLGITSYKAVESATNEQIEENLKQQALQLEMIVESVVDSVRTYEVMVEAQARGMILAQGDAVYAFITQFLGSESALFNAMGNVLVGETGYIYILDYDGNMLYHPVNPALVGTNMMNTEDANGLLFIAEQVRSGKGVSGKNLAFSTYSWLNPGETEPRDKVAGVLNIPSKQWLVVISTYYDELVDTEYENREKENLLNAFNSIVIGDTGYPFVLDSEGHYLLSANRQRDGEKIWDAKDPNGNFFIQEMIGKAKNINVGEAAIHYYPWQNQGENRPRDKIAGLVYVEEWDWIIGPSTYLEEFQEGMLAVRNITIIVCLISIIVGSLIAYLFALYMARKFNVLMSDMKKVAEGDLTLHLVDDDGKNELSSINSSFKNMVENLKELVRAIVDNATISATSAEELSASAQEVNASSEQVSSTIQEIAKGGQNLTKTASGVKVDIEEVGKAAKLVEEKSKKAAEGAAEADKAADSGVQAGSKAKDFMAKILVSSKESAEDVSQLDAKSKEISKIIEVINGISEQTNLLALNAAIEAARAGDAGRGFAVVADEVRKLAEESQNATTQIEDMIKSIQEGTSKSVMKMTESTTLVTEGSGVVGEALKSLEEIGRLAKDIGAQAQEVSAAATQANGGVEKVSKAVGEVSAIAEESAAGTEEVSASMEETTSSMTQVSSAAQELAKGADQLKQIVSRFRLDSSNQTHAESKKSVEPKKVVESAKIKT